MIPEDQDPVWKLLRSSRPVRVDPLFSRTVARAARLSGPPDPAGFPGWLRRARRALLGNGPRPAVWGLAAATAAVALVAAVVSHPTSSSPEPGLAGAPPASHPPVPTPRATTPPQGTGTGIEAVETVFTEIDSLENELDQLDRLDDLIASQDAQAIDDQLIADILF